MLAAGCGDRSIRLWDVATIRPLPINLNHESWVSSIAFAPDGKSLVAGSADARVIVWDVRSGKEVVALERNPESFTGRGQLRGNTWSVAYAPDGLSVAGGDNEGLVKVWDVATGRVIHTLWSRRSRFAYSMAFSPDSRTLAVAYDNGPVGLWDLETGQEARAIALPPDAYYFISVAFSPDGKMLAIGTGKERQSGEVLIWDIARGTLSKTLRGHTYPVLSIAFSLDGRSLVSGGQDMTLRLWDAASGREMARLTEHRNTITCVAFSPNGRTVASGGYDDTVRLWDVSAFTRGAKPVPGP
jgi:WD40 repeat protein